MNSSKVLRCSRQLTRLHKINDIPAGRRFSTGSQLLRKYSKVAGITGASIISIIAYGFTSDFKVYAYSKKDVSKTNHKCISLRLTNFYIDDKLLLIASISTKHFIFIHTNTQS